MAINHTIRTYNGTQTLKLTTRKAIMCFCRECMGFNFNEVKKCTAPLCPLFPFRTGDSHVISKERRETLAKSRQGSTIPKRPIGG